MAEKRLKTRIILRNDTAANWSSENPILLLGEAGYETDTQKLKFGDGSTAWNSLSYFGEESVYQTEVEAGADHQAAITAIVGSNEIYKGDVVIVKELIADSYRQYTAYVYDGTSWVAMDGNYSAENVILKEDITLAGNYTQVGNLTKTSTGTATFSVAGKSVAEALTEIFSKRLQPTITANPAVSVTLTSAGAKEVGTSFTPSYSASLSAGSYTYGPATGITASSWTITDSNSNSATTASGSFDAFTVGDSTSYRITAVATYEAGAVATDNLGSASDPTVQIAAGSKTGYSSYVTGYRAFFYGANTTAVALDSAGIRSLTNGGAYKSSFSITVPEGTWQVVIALPNSHTLSGVADTGAFGTDISGSFNLSTVEVEGLNGYTAATYNVYVYTPAAALGANTYNVTCA